MQLLPNRSVGFGSGTSTEILYPLRKDQRDEQTLFDDWNSKRGINRK